MLYPVDRAKFHDLRLSRKVTVEELAEKSKVSANTIEEIESGTRKAVRERTFFDLAGAFGMEPGEFEKAVLTVSGEGTAGASNGGKAASA